MKAVDKSFYPVLLLIWTVWLSDLGFTVARKQDLTLRAMNQTIGEFTLGLHTGDLALFYYSGNGMLMPARPSLRRCLVSLCGR